MTTERRQATTGRGTAVLQRPGRREEVTNTSNETGSRKQETRSRVRAGRFPVSRLLSPVGVAVLLLISAGPALAQPQSPAFKYYVWGQVRNPGAYGLSGNPDLVELLSAAGGPTEYADVTHVVLVRAITQQRMRVNLKRVLGRAQVVPLSPGDVVMVPNSPWYRIRDGMAIVTTVVSFATLVLVVANGVGK
jgi:hypothetical protein